MPKCRLSTLAGVRIVSLRFAPVRAPSLCCVNTSTWAETAKGRNKKAEKRAVLAKRCRWDDLPNSMRALSNEWPLPCCRMRQHNLLASETVYRVPGRAQIRCLRSCPRSEEHTSELHS